MRKLVSITAIAVVALGIVAISTGCRTAETKVTRESAFGFYRSYPRLTKEPRWVDSQLFLLCSSSAPVLATEATGNEVVPQYRGGPDDGPHAGARVHIYANLTAADSMASGKPTFPSGSVVVKEKLNSGGEVAAVGGMIKRAYGRFPDTGDWEFFYAAKGGEFTSGPLLGCYNCHSRVAARDYVFRRWRLERSQQE